MEKHETYAIGGIFRGKTEEGIVTQYCDRCGIPCIFHKDTLTHAGECTKLCFVCGVEQMSKDKNAKIEITETSRAEIEKRFGKDAVKDGMKKLRKLAKAVREGSEGMGG